MKYSRQLLWLGISGLPGCGKTLVSSILEAEFFKKSYKCRTGKISDIVSEETKRQGIDLTRANMYKVGENARNSEGNGVWAKRFINNYLDHEIDIILIDGIRTLSELDEFRLLGKQTFKLLAIYTKSEILLKRIINRNRPNDSSMLEKPEQILEKEIGMGVIDCMKGADYKLQNNDGDIFLYEAIISLVSNIHSNFLQKR